MKQLNPKTGTGKLSGLFGKSRQAYYSSKKRNKQRQSKENEILEFVSKIREDQPRVGTVKLQKHLNEQKGGAWIGRDKLYKILRQNNMLIKRRKLRKPLETNGNGQSIYPDLRKGMKLCRPNQLWCSDITYIELKQPIKWCYLLCITDEYSHKILSYKLATRMRWIQLCKALDEAVLNCAGKEINNFDNGLIFHSDRGSQYKSRIFKKKLETTGIRRSMTAAGKSYENPLAERLNGILKNELMQSKIFADFKQAEQGIEKAIRVYNKVRYHMSCNMNTPEQIHNSNCEGPIKKLWKQRKAKLTTKFSN